MDPQLIAAYSEISSGHQKLAEYYAGLASGTPTSAEPTPASTPAMAAGKPLRKLKDPNAPKRPPSSFFLFCSEMRPMLREKNPGMGPTDVAKELGLLWKSVDHEKYETESKTLIAKYFGAKDEYRKRSANTSVEESLKVSPAKKPKADGQQPGPSDVAPAKEMSVEVEAHHAALPNILVTAAPSGAAAATDAPKKKKKKSKADSAAPVEAFAVTIPATEPRTADAVAAPATLQKVKKAKKNKEHREAFALPKA